MHAGESLWNLSGLVTGLERRFGADASVLKALAGARNDLKVIGDLIQVPSPSDTEVASRIPVFEPKLDTSCSRSSTGSVRGPRSSAGPPDGPRSMTAEGQAAKDLCTDILNDMDDMPEEGEDFAESVKLKVGSMMESIEKYGSATSKMVSALENMRHGQLKWLHRGE